MNCTGVLALETSQRDGSVAVGDFSGELHQEALMSRARHDDDLLPAIERLLGRIKMNREQLTAVAVSIGPGGFNGLRIAIATTKMMAEVLKIKIVAVPTALVAAQSHDGPGPIVVALASKKNAAWCTRLEKTDSGWSITGEPGIADAESLDVTDVRAFLADNFLPDPVRQVCQQHKVQIHPPVIDARGCLTAAIPMIQSHLFTDPLNLAPLYPRQPEAVALWDARKNL